jgi:hypothetical protein
MRSSKEAEGRIVLFVNKKNQKNFEQFECPRFISFIQPGFAARVAGRQPSMDQSFFGSFCSQKEQFSLASPF